MKKSQQKESRKVVLKTPVADELVDLLRDEDGLADEDLLDRALDSLAQPLPRIPGEAQRMIRNGDAIALEIGPDARDAAVALIRDDEVIEPGAIRRLADRVNGKLRRARRRSRR